MLQIVYNQQNFTEILAMVAYENEIRGGTCNKTHCSSTAEEKKNTKLKMCAVRNDTETEQLRHIGLSTNTNTSIMFFSDLMPLVSIFLYYIIVLFFKV